MADGRDIKAALDISKLRATPVEEQIILNGFSAIEKRIRVFLDDGEAKEPYEFN